MQIINKMCLSLGMIKGNELRIGNTVLSCGELYNIECGEDIDQLSFEPISLTQEWLLKTFPTYRLYGFWNNGDAIYFTFGSIDEQDSVRIQYIHQLQNLFFALTQTELAIK